MNVLVLVIYVVFGIAALALAPGAYVIGREALRRRRKRQALERLAAAREVIEGLRREPLARVAQSLSRQFDQKTILAAMEGALGEAARSAELCERLGLRVSWEHTLRYGKAWNERAHAARMLGKLGVASTSATLLAALLDPHEDTTVRRAAAEALGSILDEAVVPDLCEALASLGDDGAPGVAEALVSFGPAAVEPLLRLLDDERKSARTWAARVLGQIAEPAATLPLVELLEDPSTSVRVAAAEALGRIGDSRACRALVSVSVGDPSVAVRAAAATALGRAGDDNAMTSLVEGLGDPDAHVRSRAIEALAARKPKDRSAIERALFDPSDEVRRSAALTLDRLGAVAGWAASLGDTSAEARASARTALLSVGRAGLSEALAAATRHEDAAVRAGLYGILGELGVRRHVGLLGAALADPATAARQSAALALGRIGGEEAKSLLGREKPADMSAATWTVARALTADPIWVAEAQAHVADAAGEARARAACLAEGEAIWRAFAALIRREANPWQDRTPASVSKWVHEARRGARATQRIRALRELASLTGPEVTAALGEAAVSDPSPKARALAARSLALASERWLAEPALLRALSDPAQEVALEASRALGTDNRGSSRTSRSTPGFHRGPAEGLRAARPAPA